MRHWALRVEKRAAAVLVGRGHGEEIGVVTLDDGRLDLEHREPVRAAVMAAGVAREPRAVRQGDGRNELVHHAVQ